VNGYLVLTFQSVEAFMNIVDRRLNPQGKSVPNRQRFIRRAKDQLREAVKHASGATDIADMGDGKVKVRADRLQEPRIYHDSKHGNREHILPGNKQYQEGDKIPRPQKNGGRGAGSEGSEGSEDGEDIDDFIFALSQEEFLDIFFDDLELPDLLRKQMKSITATTMKRAGYATSGSVSNLNLKRTMGKSLARRIALRRPNPESILACEDELATLEDTDTDYGIARRAELIAQLDILRRRSRRIAFIDPVDVRYNRFEKVPQPISSAVMFCLMDVSGSMTDHMKDLAKRFYKLLYLFLTRCYKNVEIVFIRHTQVASEVDENTFFYGQETGGTVISTAFELMSKIATDRFPKDVWNIYVAQASDGDNSTSDNLKTADLVTKKILPICQYFAYIEVHSEDDNMGMMTEYRTTDVWRMYETLVQSGHPIAIQKVNQRGQIYPVFRSLFSRDVKSAA
jgi:uncharacterized sporulation protein YeaH/YhbH (DUF444 family)